jgi:tetratricopeptide (TPR) repeat protein
MVSIDIADIPNIYPVIMDITGKLKRIIDAQEAKKEASNSIKDAKKYLEMRRYSLALEILEKVDTADLPHEYFSEMKDLIGLAYSGLGEFEKALEYHEKAIKGNPKYADAWSHKGHALYMLDKPEAIGSIENAIALDENNVGAWFNKAKVFQKLGEFDKARDIYLRKIIKKVDINTQLLNATYYELANIDLKEEKTEDAIRQYDDVILSCDLDAMKNARDIILKDFTLEDFLEKDPLYSSAWYAKSLAFKALGRIEEADAAKAKAKKFGYMG